MRLANLCNASAAAPRDVLVDSYEPTAEEGTNVHTLVSLALIKKAVRFASAAEEQLTELAVTWFYANIHPRFPHFTTELHLTNDRFSGNLDVLALDNIKLPKRGAIIDWKATFLEDDHTDQLMTYADLSFTAEPTLEEIEIYTGYLRKGAVADKKVDRDHVAEWKKEFWRNFDADLHRPGVHCARCKRKVGCKALVGMNRHTAQELLKIASDGATLTRDMIPEMYVRVKLFKSVIAQFERFLREQATLAPIATLAGKELRPLKIENKRVDVLAAWSILQANFSDAEMSTFLEVGTTKMLDLVAEKVEKGKGKAQDAFMDKLKRAGAVEITPAIQIRELNVKEKGNE